MQTNVVHIRAQFVVPGPMGPKKNKKKEAILSTNDDFGRLSRFAENILFWGSFFKMDFRRRPFNQKPLVFRKNPRSHLEVQGSFGDEGTFQECQKSWILKKPTIRWDRKLKTRGVYFDAEYLSAPFCRVKTPWIAIWGKMFLFGRKSSFSVFSYWRQKLPIEGRS